MRNRIAVVGLGNLGSAVADRLHGRRPLLLVDPDPGARARWSGQPQVTVAAAVDAARWDDVERAHVLVRTDEQAAAALDELDRHASDLISVHVHTTLAPRSAAALEAGRWARIRALEQPITGGAAGVREGRATVLTAGPADERDRDWISHLAGHVVTFAQFGHPTLAKLINNAVAAATTRVTAGLLTVAVDQGLDLDAMRTVLRHGSGGSWMAEALPGLGDDQARLLVKDVRLLQEQVGRLPDIRLEDEESMLATLASFHDALTAGPEGR